MASSIQLGTLVDEYQEMEIPQIWKNLSVALGAEPRDHPIVKGLSGLEHRFLAIAVDDKAKRLILVSPDPDPRIAALTQVDIQGSMPDVRVLVARPIAIDLGVLARRLANFLGSERIRLGEVTKTMQRFQALPKPKQERLTQRFFGEALAGMAGAFKHVTLPTVAQIVAVIQQAANIDWSSVLNSSGERKDQELEIPLSGLLSVDNLAIDRSHGVCPIPLFEFTEEDWALFSSADDVAAIRIRLEELGIYQYFFPQIDELTLGFVDRGATQSQSIGRAVAATDQLGHPIQTAGIIESEKELRDVVSGLREAGYLIEGELGLEVSPSGRTFRATVKYRPKESLFTKVLNRISVTINPGTLIR
jgi:hypothetical protein